MIFLYSIWLFALVPWALFAVWMLVGRRRRHWVPFLALWDAPEELRRPKKGLELPPLGLVLALLAILLGILAMTQPRLWMAGQAHDRGRITLIVDRGASMSASTQGKPRYATLAAQVAPRLLDRFGGGSVDLVDVISNQSRLTDRSSWATIVEGWKRTALDTTQPLKASIQQRLGQGEAVIVLSDRNLELAGDQLVQIKPTAAVRNAGIIALASRPGQIMVTLRATDAMNRVLTLRAGEKSVVKSVDLQPNVNQNVFVDLDATADVIEASLDQAVDDFEADDRAWLARRQSPPVIEPRIALSDEMRRVIDVYTRHRLPGESSPKLPIARPGELKSDESGIVLPQIAGVESPLGEVATRPHAIFMGVNDWQAVSAGASLASSPPGEGWTKLARTGNRILVAVKDGAIRQCWIGFDSRAFSRTPSFVILWTNLFDWTAGGHEAFTASTITQTTEVSERLEPEKLASDIEPDYWPGLFDSAEGKIARNSGGVDFGAADAADWPAMLSRLRLPPGTGVDLTPWLAIAALCCLLGAGGTWEMHRRASQGTALKRAIA